MKDVLDPRGNRPRPEDELDQALSRGSSSGEPLDPELASLAKLASDLQALAPEAGDPAIRRRVWARLLPVLREHAPARRGAPRRRAVWRPAFAVIALLTALGLLTVSAGAAYASEDALPGDLLYPLKRGIESARIALSLSHSGDAALLLEFAGERLQEAEDLAALGRVEDLNEAFAGYEEAMDALVGLAGEIPVEEGPGALVGVQKGISGNLEALERVRERVPAAAADAIERVIERAEERQLEVEQAIERGGPAVTPPGQIRRATQGADEDHGNQGENPNQGQGGGPPDRDHPTGPRDKDNPPGPP
jgi:hypothetical protein